MTAELEPVGSPPSEEAQTPVENPFVSLHGLSDDAFDKLVEATGGKKDGDRIIRLQNGGFYLGSHPTHAIITTQDGFDRSELLGCKFRKRPDGGIEIVVPKNGEAKVITLKENKASVALLSLDSAPQDIATAASEALDDQNSWLDQHSPGWGS